MSLPQLGGALLSALTELHGALDKLQYFENVLVALEIGEEPPALEGGWNALAVRYDALAVAITDAPLPTDFDPTPYQTAFGEIMDEQTRDQALAKLRGYLEQLRQAGGRGWDEARRLDDAEQETDTTSQALRALIDISSRLAQEFGGTRSSAKCAHQGVGVAFGQGTTRRRCGASGSLPGPWRLRRPGTREPPDPSASISRELF